jgi:hypothetical protein
MENNESKWTTIKGDSMYLLIDPSGAFVASASKLNCDSIASFLNNYQALKAENTLLKEVNEAQIFTIEKYQKENEEYRAMLGKIIEAKNNSNKLWKAIEETEFLLTKHSK